MWTDDLKFDDRGLVPVVAQEADTGEVLMLAFANREALERTLSTGRAHYWSRSRGEIWRKGETSGHLQEIVGVHVDCDGDAVLYRVRQRGPACHTLARTCFHRMAARGELDGAADARHVLSRLEEMVRRREAERPEGSYTAYLFEQGVDKILKKIGEEAAETIVAAKNRDPAELRAEAADLLFHLLVLLREQDLPLSEIWDELDDRFGRRSRIPTSRASEHPDD